MVIKQLINSPIPSNAYVVYNEYNKECIIIDPGTKDAKNVIDFIRKEDLHPLYIILTHEHFDHVWGTNVLAEKYRVNVICSSSCAKRLAKPQNYFNLLYFNDPTSFCINNIDVAVSKDTSLRIFNTDIQIIQTPGHTDGDVCILVDNCLFTGDTLMCGYKPVLRKRQGASEDKLLLSVKKLLNISNNLIVYPGHGAPFAIMEGKNWFRSLYPDYIFNYP